MKITFRQQAGENEVFGEDAFDNQLGKVVPVNLREAEDGPIVKTAGEARLVGVAILEHGKVAELTLEILQTDGNIAAYTADNLLRKVGPMSFSIKNH